MSTCPVWKFTFGFALGSFVCFAGPFASAACQLPPALRGKAQRTDRPARVFKGHDGVVSDVAFAPDGQTVASAGWNGTVRLWSLEEGKPSKRIEIPKSRFSCVAFSPDGKTLATGNSDKTTQLWDVATGKLRIELKGHTRGVRSVAFSPDGTTLATAGSDKLVKLWDIQSGHCQATHNRGVDAVFLPDGKTLASRREERVMLWDRQTGHPKAELKHPGKVSCLAVSPDGKTLASAIRVSGDTQAVQAAIHAGLVTLWDVETANVQGTLKGLTAQVSSLAFSPAGKRLAVADPYSVKLWNVIDHKLATTFQGHAEMVPLPRWKGRFVANPTRIWSIAFSPDGTMLAEGNGRLRTKIAPPKTGRRLIPLPTYGSAGEVYLWKVDGAEKADAASPGSREPLTKTDHDFQPKSPSKPESAKTREKRAAGKLRLAKLLLEKRPKAARRRLQNILRRFPDTKAAGEAAELLKE